jgi:flagellar hook protein FlgE
MEIQSALNSGLEGFKKATEEASQAASNIVAQTSASRDESVITQAEANQAATTNEQKIPDLNQSIVELKVAEFQAKSSAQVIKTADEVLGTLVDVTA